MSSMSQSSKYPTNEFIIMVSTINGSGSQSANQTLVRSIHHMGIPVSGKNLFPSNIAGLPTWFWIRGSEKKFLGKADQADICISLNSGTLTDDLSQIRENGFFIYNADGFHIPEGLRPDVQKIPLPVKKLVENASESMKARKYLQNIAYVGAISYLLGIEEQACLAALKDQLGEKGSMLESNTIALLNGRKYMQELPEKIQIPHRAERRSLTQDHFFIDGNSAAALGTVMGGYQFCAWYPITPSTSMIENLEKYSLALRKNKDGKNTFAIVQAEDELAAASMILGAGWAGVRAVTATSGPGISLMQETAGLSYYSDIPMVIWNVQRTGPSTGLPTRTMQGDLLSCVYSSHGDTLFPCLLPSNMEEIYEFGQVSLDLAEQMQQLVFVLTDLDLGMNIWLTPRFKYPEKSLDRGKILPSTKADEMTNYERFGDPDGDGIPLRIIPSEGNYKWAYLTRGSGHNEKGLYSERPKEYKFQMDRLFRKWETMKKVGPKPMVDGNGNRVGILAYGSTDLCISEVRERLSREGIPTDYIKIRAVPFSEEVVKFLSSHDRTYIVEQNRDGQMRKILSTEIPEYAPRYKKVCYYESIPISADFIFEAISNQEKHNEENKGA